MQDRNVPQPGLAYWATILAASVCGTNLGDLAARALHLGHTGALPLYLGLLAVILVAERFSRFTTDIYYWLVILLLRVAATNIADLATHDLKFGYPLVIAGFCALFLAALLIPGPAVGVGGLSKTDARYWIAMFAAGLIGTASGDFLADDLGIGVGPGAVGLACVIAALLILGRRMRTDPKWLYWLTILAIRTGGTNMGDYVAGDDGLNLGLPVATTCTGLVFACCVLLFGTSARRRAVAT